MTAKIPDGTYLVKYYWQNPMAKHRDPVHHQLTRCIDGEFQLFSGARVLNYVNVDDVWEEE